MTAKEALAIIERYSILNEIGQDEMQLDFDNALRFINQTLEELEAIKSADYNDTIKMLKGMHLITLDPLEATNEEEREALLYAEKKADKTNAKLDVAINALLKAQAQEKELEELKKEVLELTIDIRTSKKIRNKFYDEITRLENLCKGSEE